MQNKWIKLLVRAAQAWNADHAFQHSAAVSFYTLFSLAPITVIAIKIMGLVFGQEIATRQLAAQMAALLGPASAEVIRGIAAATQSPAANRLSTALGLFLLFVGATSVFAQLQNSLNAIWTVKAKPRGRGLLVLLIRRLVSFAMVLTLGFLLLVSLVLSTLLTTTLGLVHGRLETVPHLIKGMDFGISLVLITFLFALIYRVMPDVRLRWRDVWLGAAVAALLFGVGRYVIALYLAHSTIASIYGTAASLVALLIWIYYSCAIFFFGAEFTRAHALIRDPAIQPKTHAAQVRS